METQVLGEKPSKKLRKKKLWQFFKVFLYAICQQFSTSGCEVNAILIEQLKRRPPDLTFKNEIISNVHETYTFRHLLCFDGFIQ